MKSALITGGNRGVGRGFVEYLLDRGYQVFAGVRDSSSFPKELRGKENLIIINMDISDDEQIRLAVKEVSEHTNHLDLLVNNAGLNKDTATDNHKELVCDLKDLDRSSLNKMFDVNATSQMMVLKGFVDLLVSNPAFVINISSNRASFGDTTNTVGNYGYRASKAALNMLTACSLIDLPKNISTFAIHPGGVKTDMNPKGSQEAYKQAESMVKITENWNTDLNGKFLNYDGTLYVL